MTQEEGFQSLFRGMNSRIVYSASQGVVFLFILDSVRQQILMNMKK